MRFAPVPLLLLCTACAGTTSTSDSVDTCRLTRANWPGHSARSPLEKVAFSLIVSVAGSTALSMNVSVPVVASVLASCGVADTSSAPAPACCLISDRYTAGTENVTYTGSTCVMVTSDVELAVTRLPAFSSTLPVRPLMGDRIVA